MHIIIVGDGKVGYTLAEQLSTADHDVVIIDTNDEALRTAEDALDILAVRGNGANASVLREAGIERCDLLLAVTSRDELNMVCCLLGRKLGARNTIGRIRDPEYDHEMRLLMRELGMDMSINPEQIAAQEIARVLRYPQANNVEVFAGGRVEMLDFRVRETDPVAEKKLSEINPKLPARILFCAVEHEGQVTIPSGETVLRVGDNVHIIGESHSNNAFIRSLGRLTAPVENVMIMGGGLIALYLSRELLRGSMKVKIIDISRQKAKLLDEELDATIIVGDGTDQALLQAEDIEDMDAFVALTNRDEENLLAAIYAKDTGVKKVVAKINRENYAGIIRRMGIDSVISPKELAANHILRYVRAVGNSEGSAIETLYRIVGGQAEALEFHTCKGSRLVGTPLKDLPLKREVLVAALVRRGKIIIPGGDTVIEPKDRVIVVTRERAVDDLNDLLER